MALVNTINKGLLKEKALRTIKSSNRKTQGWNPAPGGLCCFTIDL